MNELGCPDLESLAELGRLPEGDPHRAHVDGCARCRARLISLAVFVDPASDDLPDSEWRTAEAELGRRRVRDGLVPPVRELSAQRRRAWGSRSWRPALAFAAVLLAVSGAWIGLRGRHEPVMRSADGAEWAPAIVQHGGALTLTWRAVPEANRYRVRFIDATLEPIATLEAGAALEVRVRADSLPTGLSRGQSVMVQVDALSGTDSIASSRAVPLQLP